jgi:hypothetical protein
LDGNDNNIEYSCENSLEISDNEEKKDDKIHGLVKVLNFINNYLKMKESIKNEKYIILFTDLLNIKLFEEKKIEKIFENLIGDKETILLLVGKNKELNEKKEKDNFIEDENIIEDIILSKYGEKSEIINFENMKKIKTILSNNKVIKDDIIFPNEIYK